MVDGHDTDNDDVFECHGYLRHGCPICFPNELAEMKILMSKLKFLTENKMSYLRACGLTITVL